MKKFCLFFTRQKADTAAILEKSLDNKQVTITASTVEKPKLFLFRQTPDTATILNKSLSNKNVNMDPLTGKMKKFFLCLYWQMLYKILKLCLIMLANTATILKKI